MLSDLLPGRVPGWTAGGVVRQQGDGGSFFLIWLANRADRRAFYLNIHVVFIATLTETPDPGPPTLSSVSVYIPVRLSPQRRRIGARRCEESGGWDARHSLLPSD